MGYRRKRNKIAAALLAFGLMLTAVSGLETTALAADGELSLEQAWTNLPDIEIYVNGMENYGEPDAAQIEVYRGTEKLTLDGIQTYSELGEGTAYYILLDISGSIKDAYFEDIKGALQSFADGLSEADRLALITFGETVQTCLTGDEAKEDAKAKIAALSNSDDQTLLFEALAQAGDQSSNLSGDSCKRHVAIVISDGDDIAKGKSTRDEALADLKEHGLPVYALAVDYESQDVLDSFGEFARNTGGEMEVFGQGGASAALESVKTRLANTKVLLLTSGNNLASQSVETLTVQFHQWNLTKTVDAGFYHWQADETAPEMTEVTQTGERSMQVTFNESVKNADEASNYQLTAKEDGTVYTPVSVEVLETEAYRVSLTFQDAFYAGDYTLETVNLTDTSAEENALTQTVDITLTGEERPVETTNFFREYGYLLAIAAVVVLALILIIVFRRIKKNKSILTVDGKITSADQVEIKRHVSIEEGKQADAVLMLTLKSVGKKAAKMEVPIEGSLIAGRSDICDIYFDDAQMSRQHFAMEYADGVLTVTDLDTTNGTMVNGVRIHGKRKLEKGDRIVAGQIEIIVDWRENE